MKKYYVIILIVLCLCGCSRMPEAYPFENKDEAIKTIELLYYPWYTDESKPFMEFETIRTLKKEEIHAFMESIYALDTRKSAPTPPGNYGMYIARINYENGDTEYLGSTHIEFVKSGETACAVGYYYFAGDGFERLFLEYAGDWQLGRNAGDGSLVP